MVFLNPSRQVWVVELSQFIEHQSLQASGSSSSGSSSSGGSAADIPHVRVIDCPAGTTESHAVLLMANQLPSYIQRWGDEAAKSFGAKGGKADVPDVETTGMPDLCTKNPFGKEAMNYDWGMPDSPADMKGCFHYKQSLELDFQQVEHMRGRFGYDATGEDLAEQ